MSWLRIDDHFAENEKIVDLSDRAFRLHVAALCYCARNLTDGKLDSRGIKVSCAIVAGTKRHISELVEASLWVATPGDKYKIKDFNEYNPTAKQVKIDRAKARERMKKIRNGSPERSPEHQAERSPERAADVRGPRPVPYPIDTTKAVTRPDGTASDQEMEEVRNIIDRSLREAS